MRNFYDVKISRNLEWYLILFIDPLSIFGQPLLIDSLTVINIKFHPFVGIPNNRG